MKKLAGYEDQRFWPEPSKNTHNKDKRVTRMSGTPD